MVFVPSQVRKHSGEAWQVFGQGQQWVMAAMAAAGQSHSWRSLGLLLHRWACLSMRMVAVLSVLLSSAPLQQVCGWACVCVCGPSAALYALSALFSRQACQGAQGSLDPAPH